MSKIAVDKNNRVLEQLVVEYAPMDSIRPNMYNPNRQSEHDFELLCKSIASDGFTQPVIVNRSTREIVDGEHRWRACRALGFAEVPVVFTDMTPEQARISTLRHNRARGSEDASLAADLLKELAAMGAADFAQSELMLDDVEMQRLLNDMPSAEAGALALDVDPSKLGPNGKGLSELDKTTNPDLAADERRAKEEELKRVRKQEESAMAHVDRGAFRLMLIYTGEEARVVKAALAKLGCDGSEKTLPEAVIELCKRARIAAPVA